ncbi:MAG: UbiD family decarboxylase [Candidatus Baldrarchaeia archaeon]
MSLRDFLDSLIPTSVKVIEEELDVKFEIAYVIKKFERGPTLLFTRIKGYPDAKIVSNLFFSRDSVRKCLNVSSYTEVYEKILYAIRNPSPPQEASDAPVLQVSRSPNLHDLPVLTYYARDPGPYVTSAIVIAQNREGSIKNASVHRLLLKDKQHFVIRIVPRHLYTILKEFHEKNEPLPVAIVIGVHPLLLLSAASPAPFGVFELHVANTLLNGRLRTISSPIFGIEVPADAEYLIEGEILPEEADEGPFVDITGTYDVMRKQPLVRVKRIYHRKHPIFHAILPAGAEHRIFMGLPMEAKIWDYVRQLVPHVRGVNLTDGGCGWLHAVISIRKNTDGDGKNVALAAFAAHPSLKHVVVVDDDINPYDMREVEWAIATRFNAERDLIIIRGARGSSLDPTADQRTLTITKMAIDATRSFDIPKHKVEKAHIPVPRKER